MRTNKRHLAIELQQAIEADVSQGLPPGTEVSACVDVHSKGCLIVDVLVDVDGGKRQVHTRTRCIEKEPEEWIAVRMLRNTREGKGVVL